MLKAKDANRITKEAREIQIKAAKDMVLNEWEEFIEPRISQNALAGKFSFNYYWFKNIFIEMKVDPEDFVEAFINFAAKLGYKTDSYYTKGNNEILRVDITIKWGSFYE